VFGRWCDRCWAELTHEEQLAAADAAAMAEDHDPRLAPPRLAGAHERRNGNGHAPDLNYIAVKPETTAEAQALKAEGWRLSHFTVWGTPVWKRAR
jgi:hypothetical protein